MIEMANNMIVLSPDIMFPNLGIQLNEINSVAFKLFGIEVYWYGILISLGIMGGLYMAVFNAKRDGQDPDIYFELLFYGLLVAFVGARTYYVAFEWDSYKGDIVQILNIRNGGLAIYGGVIGGILATTVYARTKRLNVLTLLDTGATGMLVGQSIGRWGNFMNMEAFGGYTDSLFAMAIKADTASYVPIDTVLIDGVEYLQVHPTFLYESVWNLGVLALLVIYFTKRKFQGEVFLLYLFGYGLGRVWIEGLRTDQLIIGNTGIPVSQLLSGILVVVSLGVIVLVRRRIRVRENESIRRD